MKALPIGSRYGYARLWRVWFSVWLRCATREAEDQQAGSQRGQPDIVKDDTAAGRCERDRKQHERRPRQIENRDDQRGPSESGIGEHHNRDLAREAQPGVQSGLAGKSNARLLDREIAHVERVTDRTKSDDQQPVRRARTWQEQFHTMSMQLQRCDDQRCAICSPSNLTDGQAVWAALKCAQSPVAAGPFGS